jgi:hypothetical protein
MTRRALCFSLVFAWGAALAARQPQPYFTDAFPREEFAARRRVVMDRIGDAIAVLQGAPEMSAEVAFRQLSDRR